MSSLKMTFSLTSLILIFAMLVAPTAVMAEAGGPTITSIVLDPGTTATAQARNALVFKITFSGTIDASTFTTADTFAATLTNASGNSILQPTQTVAPADNSIATLPTANMPVATMFKFTIDSTGLTSFANDPAGDPYTANHARGIVLRLPKDLVTGATVDITNTIVAGKTNQVSGNYTFTLPQLVTNSVTVTPTVAQKMDGGGDPIANRYTLTLAFANAGGDSTAPNPVAPSPSDIVVTGGTATPVDATGAALTGAALTTALVAPDTTNAPGTFTQDYNIPGALTGLQFGLHAGYLAGSTPSTPVSTPDFGDGKIADIVIWKGQAFDSYKDTDEYLPLAHDALNTPISYSFEPALPAGLEAREIDAQSRFIMGKATAKMDPAGTYMYVATNDTGGRDTISFKIKVMDPIKPTAPTMVMAMEEGSMDDNTMRTVNTNRVEVDWEAPVDTTETSHDPEIPFGSPLTKYVVHWDEVDEDGEKVSGGESGMSDVEPKNKVLATEYRISKLPIGLYEIKVQAVNAVGTAPDLDKAKPVTVLVANPPDEPTDLRAAKGVDAGSVNLDWKLPEDDGGADITAHIIYHNAPGSTEAVEIDADADRFHTVTGVTADGRHVFRVASVNSDGAPFNISDGTAFTVDNPASVDNQGPTFGNLTVSNVTATVGTAIPGTTLPAATDPDGDDSVIEYSIDPDVEDIGLTFNDETRFLSGTPDDATDGAVTYTYTATDDDGAETSLNFTITVNAVKVVTPPVSADLDASYDPATGVTTIRTAAEAGTMIDMNGFATIGADDLPDLEEFFEIGGTIGLSNGDETDDKNSRTVVISEILWGLDYGAPAMDQTQWQFIELYNTTGAAIDLDGWTLTFTGGNVVPASDIDQMSNRGRTGWDVDSGDTGKSGRVTGTLATDLTSAITPSNIVSMYRNIDYDKVEKTHNANDAADNRKKQLDGFPGGNAKGSWKASQRRSTYNRWIYDSKRAKHFKSQPILSPSSVAGTPFRINEIGNDSGSENDWVELHNVTDSEQSLKNYSLSQVTAQGTDTRIFHFHDQDWKVPAKGFVVISTRHPRDTDLAAGKDISVADDQEENKGASHLFVIKTVNLDDGGKFALILRNHHEKQKTDEHLIDVVATRQGAFADNNISSDLWPLKATGLPHDNVIDGGDENFAAGKVYQRNSGNGRGEKQFAVRGFTGVGYDRAAEDAASNGGTPGYDNSAVKEKIADLSDAEITISEIMLSVGDGRLNLPQWIELYNSSMTQSVNLNGWKLHVENYSDVETALDAVLTLDTMVISPNQTVLIVTNTGRVSDPDHFPNHRVVNLWTTKKHRDALEMVRRTDQVFSTMGFNLQLYDKDNKLVDEAGNLDGNRRTRDELEDTWTVPINGDDDERRSSLLRVYEAGVAVDGTMEEGWVLADETNLAFAISQTYYGDPDDFGTPGFRAGGPLPVSLSKFRPERLKDTGEIVVRWITESELNNAGFNILRSEKRDGEFTKVHFEAGQGTTSERNVYEWKDKSAKPNVVYYYQIQDVSIDGDVTTLRTTHLRGNVTAVGKATTTWGEIKALQ